MDLMGMGAETLTGKTCGSVQFLRFCSVETQLVVPFDSILPEA